MALLDETVIVFPSMNLGMGVAILRRPVGLWILGVPLAHPTHQIFTNFVAIFSLNVLSCSTTGWSAGIQVTVLRFAYVKVHQYS